MRDLGNYAAIFTLVGGALFILTYAFMARWWRSLVGIAIMGLATCLTFTFGFVVVSLYFGTVWPHRELIRAVIFLGCGVPLWVLELALVFGQYRKRQQERLNDHGKNP